MTPGPTDGEPLTEDELREMAWAYVEVRTDRAPPNEDTTLENTPPGPCSRLRHLVRRASRLVSEASERRTHFDRVEVLLVKDGDPIALGDVSIHQFRTSEGRISLRGELMGPKEPLRNQLRSANAGFFLRFSNGRVSPAVLDSETLIVMGDSPFT